MEQSSSLITFLPGIIVLIIIFFSVRRSRKKNKEFQDWVKSVEDRLDKLEK